MGLQKLLPCAWLDAQKRFLNHQQYNIKVNFDNTPVRTVGNLISLLSIFVVAFILLKTKFYAKKITTDSFVDSIYW